MSKLGYFGVITGSTGRWLLTKVNRIINQMAFFWVCIKTMIRYRGRGRAMFYRIVVQQIYFTGVQSVELIVLIALLLGALGIVQGFTQLARVGSLDELSHLVIWVLIRGIGPMMTAIVIILRSGSAIAMEIGYMNVLGEIEGLEMQGIPTMHFLCFPRIVGVSLSVICLMIIFDLVAVAGGFFLFSSIEGIAVWDFIYNLATSLTWGDFFVVAVKGVSFGLIIPVVCLYYGYMAQGAITSVPPAVSRALVDSLIYIVILNIIVSAAI